MNICTQILADQKAPPAAAARRYYYVPPQIFRLWTMPEVYTKSEIQLNIIDLSLPAICTFSQNYMESPTSNNSHSPSVII